MTLHSCPNDEVNDTYTFDSFESAIRTTASRRLNRGGLKKGDWTCKSSNTLCAAT